MFRLFSEHLTSLKNKFSIDYIDNPKILTLSILKSGMETISKEKNDLSEANNLEFFPFPNAFFKIKKSDMNPKTDMQLRNYFFVHGASFSGIGVPSKNKNINALNEIISQFQNKKIKIVLFTTPQSAYYLDAMPNSERQSFDTALNYIQTTSKVKIHSLNDEYTKKEVWEDPTHFVINGTITLYSDDVSKIILDELDQ